MDIVEIYFHIFSNVPIIDILITLFRSLNHIATVNEITSKAVIMYKEMDNPQTPLLRKRNPPTPVLFMIGDGSENPEVED